MNLPQGREALRDAIRAEVGEPGRWHLSWASRRSPWSTYELAGGDGGVFLTTTVLGANRGRARPRPVATAASGPSRGRARPRPDTGRPTAWRIEYGCAFTWHYSQPGGTGGCVSGCGHPPHSDFPPAAINHPPTGARTGTSAVNTMNLPQGREALRDAIRAEVGEPGRWHVSWASRRSPWLTCELAGGDRGVFLATAVLGANRGRARPRPVATAASVPSRGRARPRPVLRARRRANRGGARPHLTP